eukprot:1859321-Prymnesium_polylepis.2
MKTARHPRAPSRRRSVLAPAPRSPRPPARRGCQTVTLRAMRQRGESDEAAAAAELSRSDCPLRSIAAPIE